MSGSASYSIHEYAKNEAARQSGLAKSLTALDGKPTVATIEASYHFGPHHKWDGAVRRLTISVFSLSALVFAGTGPEKPKTAPILIHEHLSKSCELVQSGQLFQYRDYSTVVVDSVPGELYSLELVPGSFIEPTDGAAKEIKSASKAGFVVRGRPVSILSNSPRVVAIVTGAECPAVQDAITLATEQRKTRRASIQAKLYRPDHDHVTRPMPLPLPHKPDTSAINAAAALPSGQPKVMHGTVVLAVVIGPDGAVRDTKVVRSVDAWLDLKATEEVRTWRFQPARKQGLPVAALINVEVNFNLH